MSPLGTSAGRARGNPTGTGAAERSPQRVRVLVDSPPSNTKIVRENAAERVWYSIELRNFMFGLAGGASGAFLAEIALRLYGR